jgi:membrane associated rhomboid family serine protease
MVRWTFVFIVACVIVFFFQIMGFFDWRAFAFTPGIASDAPWTYVTSVFLHANFTHLLINMLVLFFLGSVLERQIGSTNFLILFILAGIGGSIGYMVTATDPMTPALGASGAINGVIGALAVVMPFMMVFVWGLVPLPMIVVALLWAVMDFFGLFTPSGVAHGAHLGGLFIGVLYGLYLRVKLKRKRRVRIDF